MKWVERELEPTYTDLGKEEDVDKIVDAMPEKARMCVGTGVKGSPLHAAFEKTAKQFRASLVFLWVDSPSEHEDKHGIRLYEKGQEGGPDTCPDTSSSETVIAWLNVLLS